MRKFTNKMINENKKCSHDMEEMCKTSDFSIRPAICNFEVEFSRFPVIRLGKKLYIFPNFQRNGIRRKTSTNDGHPIEDRIM